MVQKLIPFQIISNMCQGITVLPKFDSRKYFETAVVNQRDALDQNSNCVVKKHIPNNFKTSTLIDSFFFFLYYTVIKINNKP